MNHSSTTGGQGYPQENGEYPVDPNLMNESPWALPSQQYAHHDTFNPQQTYQQYPASHSYGGYGVSQDSMYPDPSYSNAPAYQSAYVSQFQPSNQADLYALSQYGLPPSQAHSRTPQSFSGSSSSFPYSSFGAETPTISPQALQRIDVNIHQSQRNIKLTEPHGSNEADSAFHQGWGREVPGGFQSHNVISQTGVYDQQIPVSGGAVEYPSLSDDAATLGSSHVAGTYSQGTEISKNPVVRKGKSTMRQSSLRITDPELLSATENSQVRRLSSAPFLVLDEEPVDLKISGKTYKPVKNSSGKPLVPTLDNSTASATPPPIIKRGRGRPPKSATSANKSKSSNLGLKQTPSKEVKSRITIGVKPTDSPSPVEESSSSEVESSTGDETDYEDEDEMPIEKLSDVREDERPSNVVAAAAWDATGIVWAPRTRHAKREEIIEGAKEFQDFIVKLREGLKTINTDLAAAEAENRLEDAESLKDARTMKRNAINSAIQAAVKNGHPDVLENLGNSPKLVNSLVSGVLMDCIKAEDYNGELPRAIFRLMSRFKNLTDELLQKVKFDSIEKRFNKKADSEIKDYITTIRSSTPEGKERAKKVKEEAAKDEKQKSLLAAQEASKVQKAEEALKAASASGLKRSHELDASSGKPNKKVASDANAVGSNQKAPAAKPRPHTNFFANLKRTGPKTPAGPKVPAVPAIAPIKKPEPKPETTPIPQSSLAAILASIEKPRDVPKPPEAPPRPPETPEERARRERKESRRHLRVRWKDGNALVEVRLFTHEQAEDEGRQDGMLRDAHDDRSEGMMLKKRVLETMADDDDDTAGEIEYRPYPELVSIDFSGMNSTALQKNYVTRGGQVLFTTPQQQVQDRRESLELMVVYTDPKDIPPSPKEPPQANYEKAQAERDFGYPSAPWLVQRLREIYQYGNAGAMSIWVQRLEEQNFNKFRISAQSYPFSQQSSATPDITSILNAMKTLPAQSQQLAANQFEYQPSAVQNLTPSYNQPTHQPPSQSDTRTMDDNDRKTAEGFANLTRTVESLKNKPFPPTEPPEWMNEYGKARWWEGYNRDKAIAGRQIAEAKAAKMQPPQTQAAQMQASQMQTPPMQTPMPAPQMQYPQMPTYPPPLPNMAAGATPSYDLSQLQGIVTGFNQGQNNAMPPQLQNILAGLNNSHNNPTPSQQQQSWVGGWPGTTSGNNGPSYPNQNQQPRWDNVWSGANATESTRPTYDTSNQDNAKNRSRDSGYSGGDERYRSNGGNEHKRGMKPCKFWQEGKCAKGTKCTFLHE